MQKAQPSIHLHYHGKGLKKIHASRGLENGRLFECPSYVNVAYPQKLRPFAPCHGGCPHKFGAILNPYLLGYLIQFDHDFQCAPLQNIIGCAFFLIRFPNFSISSSFSFHCNFAAKQVVIIKMGFRSKLLRLSQTTVFFNPKPQLRPTAVARFTKIIKCVIAIN